MSHKQSQLGNFSYIELAGFLPDGKMLRDEIVQIDDIEKIAAWREKFNNTDIFSSICIYATPQIQSQNIAPLFFDIDSTGNLEAARENALILCELIMMRLDIDSDQIQICFSGYKGFHVTVPCEIFDPVPSQFAIELNKKMAFNAQKQGVPSVDTSVYAGRRLWRLVNSINSKSGLYKIPVTHKELMHLSADKIVELAKQPRSEEILAAASPNQRAIKWYQHALSCMAKIQEKSAKHREYRTTAFKCGWRTPPCIKNILQSTLPDGIRHNAYLCIARFYSWINMHPNEIDEQLNRLDQKNPIRDPQSIQRIITWANEHPGFAGCDNEVLKKYCDKDACFYHKLKLQELNMNTLAYQNTRTH